MKVSPNGQPEAAPDVEVRVEARLRKIFIGCLIICILIVMHLLVLGLRGSDYMRMALMSLLPILLWTVVVTGYAFTALWSIAEHREAALQELADRDSLTGAYSCSYMERLLAGRQADTTEQGDATAFAYVGLGGLKEINAEYGHAAGNIVLRELARILIQLAPPGSTVSRLGGQEFCVLMPETTAARASDSLQTIQRKIRDYRLDLGRRGAISGLDATVGFTVFPAEGRELDDLIRAARPKPTGASPVS